MTDFGIYVHIPFCEKKCKYCSFVSGVQNQSVQEEYFARLNEEIEKTTCKKQITSIFFGGGTPSAVNEKFIISVLSHIKAHFSLTKNVEITLEANPNSVNLEKLFAYKKAGFNRISFGAQSFSNVTLKKLGRVHNKNQIFEAIKNAKKVGFDNISIDLILGASPISKTTFEKNIILAKNCGVTHISAYILMLEKGTVLFQEVKSMQTKIVNDSAVVKDYYFVKNILEKNGFMQYEISNFAQLGFESRHNQNYWQCGEYLGFGISAHSFVNGERYENTSSLRDYLSPNFSLSKIQLNKEKLNNAQKIEECIMLSLRTKQGIDLSYLKTLGYDLQKEKSQEILLLQKQNLITLKNNFLSLTSKGLVVSNSVILELI